MLNWIFLGLIAIAVLTGAFTGTLGKVTDASLSSAKSAVELAIGLVGQMTLWLGFMGVLREAGLMRSLANALQPLMKRLFPDVPPEHPAMSAMIMNLSANLLGLNNAATPFGLKAMGELDKLNPHRGVATNAMALFLVINTSGVVLIPISVVAVRSALGSHDAMGVTVPSIIATLLSTAVAVLVAKLLEKRPMFAPEKYRDSVIEGGPADLALDAASMKEAEAAAAPKPPASGARLAVIAIVIALMAWALYRHVDRSAAPGVEIARGVFSEWLLPVLMLTIVLFAMGRQVKVYEAFIASAKEGFQIAIVIIPFLVAMLVAVGMFRASGAMEAFSGLVGPWTAKIGFPAEALPMALMRPLSGQGSLGIMTETMKAHGPDSYVGYLVSLINGSSETTFYVLALYYGAVQVKAVRHTLAACLISDGLGLLITVAVCQAFFGGAA